MISKTKLKQRMKNKNKPLLVETFLLAKNNEKWSDVAKVISSSRRKKISLNLKDFNKDEIKEGDTIVVPGKVLGNGNIRKKIKIVALDFSEGAKEKLSKQKIEISYLKEEIEKNSNFTGVKLYG